MLEVAPLASSPTAPLPLGMRFRRRARLALAWLLSTLLCPSVPHRTRATEIMIRFIRATYLTRGLTAQHARGLESYRVDPADLPDVTVATKRWIVDLTSSLSAESTDGLPVVHLESPLQAKYAPPSSPLAWELAGEWMHPASSGPAPSPASSDRVILWIHGGAYALGSVARARGNVARLVAVTGRPVFSLEYRLAPEHVFPAALHDAVAAFLYLTRVEGIAPHAIVIAGDSAGGALAMTATLFLRDHGLAMPGGVALVSPLLDLDHSRLSPSETENAHLDILGDFSRAAAGEVCFNAPAVYLGLHRTNADRVAIARTEHLASPIVDVGSSDRQLPPVYISTGMAEMLADSNVLYAALLTRIPGRPRAVVHDIHRYRVHVFPFLEARTRDAARAVERIARFVNDVVGAKDDGGEQQRVEVAVFDDGEIVARGAKAGWAPRWKGIQIAKRVDWESTASGNDVIVRE
ncbi:hypothetical protein H9P43_004626 [Blastocladiella emersonii ATCC 22665]|nr:hypothetical protein H9P43_004626 [Blastocladiella emersonii ATCC 22665]